MKIKSVIMAGGVGSRLWPLSRQNYPKQFVKLLDNFSLMQRTIINNISFGQPTLMIIKEYEEIVKNQLTELGVEADLIIEPLGRNTAACAIISAIAAKQDNYEIIILLPCDHYIDNIDKYLQTISKCLKYVSKFGVCTIGIQPDRPDTEYGYIKTNQWMEEGVYQANNFIEKPNLLQAQTYLQDEQYFWNSGIFIFSVDFILEQAKLWQKKLFTHSYNALNKATRTNNNIMLALKPYLRIKPISLDYAIIQNINQMVMVRGDFSWCDLGNWYRLWQMQHKDTLNNYYEGDIIQVDTTNSYLHSKDKLTVVVGVDNLIIINTNDALLIVKKSKVEQVKQLVLQMTRGGREEI